MKKIAVFLILVMLLSGCAGEETPAAVVASTRAVYDFTTALCADTDITVSLLVTEPVSCLHDYTLQVKQMTAIENCRLLVLSGGGLEAFLDDALHLAKNVCDASENIALHHGQDHDDHAHADDPHIWLSAENAAVMAENIAAGLQAQFPQHSQVISGNLENLLARLDALQSYGNAQLSQLQTRKLITFHDGFSYFAEGFDLTVLAAVEEESGSEASASTLIDLITLVQEHSLPGVFTEVNGSVSAASVIAAETGAKLYCLDMAMGQRDYFSAMYHNIDTVKEALG